MKRLTGLLATSLLAGIGLAPAVARQLPDASLDPREGAAGTTVTITVSQYSPNIEIFVYEGGDDTGTLLGTGMTGAGGSGSFPVTIPVDAPVGSYLMYICGQCDAQFPEWATRGFTVTSSPGTTTTSSSTTTTAATTTTTTVTETSTTTAESPPTTAASASGDEPASTTTVVPVAADADDSGSSDLVVPLVIVAFALAMMIGALLVGLRNRPTPPPPPPPPAG